MLKTLKDIFRDEKGIATIDTVILVGAIIAGGVIVGLAYNKAVNTASGTINTNLQSAVNSNWNS